MPPNVIFAKGEEARANQSPLGRTAQRRIVLQGDGIMNAQNGRLIVTGIRSSVLYSNRGAQKPNRKGVIADESAHGEIGQSATTGRGVEARGLDDWQVEAASPLPAKPSVNIIPPCAFGSVDSRERRTSTHQGLWPTKRMAKKGELLCRSELHFMNGHSRFVRVSTTASGPDTTRSACTKSITSTSTMPFAMRPR